MNENTNEYNYDKDVKKWEAKHGKVKYHPKLKIKDKVNKIE